jgi:solute carrier family 25, member 38
MAARPGPPAVHGLAGAASSAVACVLLQPLDVLKTRQQLWPAGLPRPYAEGGGAGWRTPARLARATHSHTHTRTHTHAHSLVLSLTRYLWRVGHVVVRSAGWAALWRGTGVTLARTVPGAALYFPLLHSLQRALGTDRPTHGRPGETAAANMAAGACARALAGALLSPLTLVKARFEVKAVCLALCVCV